jgi:hypothetical protein
VPGPLFGTYSGNGNGNRIASAGGSIGSTGRDRLTSYGVGYDILGDVTISGGAGSPKLTIDPGLTIRFAATAGLFVNGSLIADASAVGAQPIVLTTINNTPAPGQWMGVIFSSGGTGTLKNMSVLWAGYNRYGNLFGLRFDNDGSTLSNVTVDHSGGFGVMLNGGCSALPNTTLTNNTSYGLYLSYIQCDPTLTGLSYTSNSNGNRMGIGGGNIGTTGRNRLANIGFGYDVLGDVYINGPAGGPTLTIDPGLTIRVGPTIALFVNGTLIADASAVGAQPIVLTTINGAPAAGQWMGVFFQGGSGTLKNMTVQYAGYNRLGTQFGIRLDNVGTGMPAWSKVTLANNAGTGLELNGNSNVVITQSNFQNGPAAKGITNNGSVTNSVNALNSYGNAASGPTIASNPGGTGDAIIGTGATRVQYSPFSTTPN